MRRIPHLLLACLVMLGGAGICSLVAPQRVVLGMYETDGHGVVVSVQPLSLKSRMAWGISGVLSPGFRRESGAAVRTASSFPLPASGGAGAYERLVSEMVGGDLSVLFPEKMRDCEVSIRILPGSAAFQMPLF